MFIFESYFYYRVHSRDEQIIRRKITTKNNHNNNNNNNNERARRVLNVAIIINGTRFFLDRARGRLQVYRSKN